MPNKRIKRRITYLPGDISDVIKTLETNSVDLIYTDPPFGTTRHLWDKGLDWANIWPEIWRVLKPNGVAVIYASMPFTYTLLRSTDVMPKYHWTWIKNNTTNHLNVRTQPLRNTEEIFVFARAPSTYNTQMLGSTVKKKTAPGDSGYYGPQKKDYKLCGTLQTGSFPTTAMQWPIRRGAGGITRTDEQIDFFIKTYSNKGDTVLDMSCHSEVVGNRCGVLKRRYIGVDIDMPEHLLR